MLPEHGGADLFAQELTMVIPAEEDFRMALPSLLKKRIEAVSMPINYVRSRQYVCSFLL